MSAQILSLAFFPIASWLLLARSGAALLAYGAFAGLAAGFMALGRDQVAYLGLCFWPGVALAQLGMRRLAHHLRDASGPAPARLPSAAPRRRVPVCLTLLLAAASNRPAIDSPARGRARSIRPFS